MSKILLSLDVRHFVGEVTVHQIEEFLSHILRGIICGQVGTLFKSILLHSDQTALLLEGTGLADSFLRTRNILLILLILHFIIAK